MKPSQDKLSLFNWLIQKYQRKIYWHVRKMVISHDDADDLTQEVFLKVWQGLIILEAILNYLLGYTVLQPTNVSIFEK
jgi:DNA-directed RNA polymerase specialized sigma24 family protein